MILSLFFYLLLNSVFAQNVQFPLKSAEMDGRMVVVDSSGERVKLSCVNWYGAHMEDMVVNGLDRRPVDDIAATIASLGFNCIRLPFALDTYFLDPVVAEERLSANPQLVGKTAMAVLDATIAALANQGLIILLNNHISTAQWCCSETDGEGLWYTKEYPTELFEEGLLALAARYKDNQFVAGMDLRNEIRKSHGHLANWGEGGENDWGEEAERIGNLLLEVDPELLIIVEGLNYATDIQGAKSRPIELTSPDKLVYSGHVYPFFGWIVDQEYPQFKETMESLQLYVSEAGHDYSAPYWLGEFGTGSDDNNWGKIVQLLQETDSDWAYWSIDGYKYPGEEESYGILNSDYKTVRHQWKLEQLQGLMQKK